MTAIRQSLDMLLGKNTWSDHLEAGEPVRFSRSVEERDEYWRSRLGHALPLLGAGVLVQAEAELRRDRTQTTETKWSVHCCLFDAEDRLMRAPPRVHLNTPWFHLMVALGPHGAAGRLQEPSWAPPRSTRATRYYLNNWVVIDTKKPCHKVTQIDFFRENSSSLKVSIDNPIASYSTCPLKAGHSGLCWNWKSKQMVSSPVFVTSATREKKI